MFKYFGCKNLAQSQQEMHLIPSYEHIPAFSVGPSLNDPEGVNGHKGFSPAHQHRGASTHEMLTLAFSAHPITSTGHQAKPDRESPPMLAPQPHSLVSTCPYALVVC